MEIAQILEVTTDYLLFGTEQRHEGRFQKYFENKTEKQIEYLCKLLETTGENRGLLYLKFVVNNSETCVFSQIKCIVNYSLLFIPMPKWWELCAKMLAL